MLSQDSSGGKDDRLRARGRFFLSDLGEEHQHGEGSLRTLVRQKGQPRVDSSPRRTRRMGQIPPGVFMPEDKQIAMPGIQPLSRAANAAPSMVAPGWAPDRVLLLKTDGVLDLYFIATYWISISSPPMAFWISIKVWGCDDPIIGEFGGSYVQWAVRKDSYGSGEPAAKRAKI